MAIQMKRGNLADLDKSRLTAGEIVVATDQDYVGVAKAPSRVMQLATFKDLRKKGNVYAIENGCFTLYVPPKKGKWIQYTEPPMSGYQANAVVYHDKVHLLGGANNPTAHYSWDGTTWTEESTIPFNFVLGSAVVWNDEIHLLGSSSAASAHYSWDGSTWTQETSVPVTFYGENNAVLFDNKINTVSSLWGHYAQHRYICKYDGSWTSQLNPVNQQYTSCAAYNGKIYLLGGSGTGGGTYQTYNGTDFDGSGSIPYQFFYGYALVYNGKIHLLGSSQRYCTKKHYKFDGTTFTETTDMPYDFHSSPAVVFNGAIHIFGSVNNPKDHRSYTEPEIYSALYPKAYVYNKGSISSNNGNRSPVKKANNGDSVCFIVRNGQGDSYGGNWIVTMCISLSRDAALLTSPNTGAGVGSYTINGVTYYYGFQSSNRNWGGATQVTSPVDVPIFDDWFICAPNAGITQAKFEEILQTLGIETS